MDLVFLRANVLTMERAGYRARAVAMDKGKIVAVGDNAEVEPLVDPGTRVVQLRVH